MVEKMFRKWMNLRNCNWRGSYSVCSLPAIQLIHSAGSVRCLIPLNHPISKVFKESVPSDCVGWYLKLKGDIRKKMLSHGPDSTSLPKKRTFHYQCFQRHMNNMVPGWSREKLWWLKESPQTGMARPGLMWSSFGRLMKLFQNWLRKLPG